MRFGADLPDDMFETVLAQVDVDGDGRVEVRELLEAYGFALHDADHHHVAQQAMPTPPEDDGAWRASSSSAKAPIMGRLREHATAACSIM